MPFQCDTCAHAAGGSPRGGVGDRLSPGGGGSQDAASPDVGHSGGAQTAPSLALHVRGSPPRATPTVGGRDVLTLASRTRRARCRPPDATPAVTATLPEGARATPASHVSAAGRPSLCADRRPGLFCVVIRGHCRGVCNCPSLFPLAFP